MHLNIAHYKKCFKRRGSEDRLGWKRLEEKNIDETMRGRHEYWDELSDVGDESEPESEIDDRWHNDDEDEEDDVTRWVDIG